MLHVSGDSRGWGTATCDHLYISYLHLEDAPHDDEDDGETADDDRPADAVAEHVASPVGVVWLEATRHTARHQIALKHVTR